MNRRERSVYIRNSHYIIQWVHFDPVIRRHFPRAHLLINKCTTHRQSHPTCAWVCVCVRGCAWVSAWPGLCDDMPLLILGCYYCSAPKTIHQIKNGGVTVSVRWGRAWLYQQVTTNSNTTTNNNNGTTNSQRSGGRDGLSYILSHFHSPVDIINPAYSFIAAIVLRARHSTPLQLYLSHLVKPSSPPTYMHGV